MAFGATIADVDNMMPLHNGSDVNINVRRRSWLCQSSGGRDKYFPDLESTACPSSDEIGLTPLHAAALFGDSQMVELLLEHGADPNAMNEYRQTALHLTLGLVLHGPQIDDDWSNTESIEEIAVDLFNEMKEEEVDGVLSDVRRIRRTIFEILIRHPTINPRIKECLGQTPLHVLCYSRNFDEDVLQRLIEGDVDINGQNNDGRTALHQLASVGSSAAVELLLQHSTNINILDYKGENVLMHGAYSGNIDVVSRILQVESLSNFSVRWIVRGTIHFTTP